LILPSPFLISQNWLALNLVLWTSQGPLPSVVQDRSDVLQTGSASIRSIATHKPTRVPSLAALEVSVRHLELSPLGWISLGWVVGGFGVVVGGIEVVVVGGVVVGGLVVGGGGVDPTASEVQV